MSTKKRVGILISVVILCVTLVVGYLTIGYTYQEYRLKDEVSNLTKLDISKDKYDTKYVTLGDYRKVESSIKEYLNEYASCMQEINTLVNDSKINKLISYDNLNVDSYNDSIDYLNNTLGKINKDIDRLIDLSDELTIRNYILRYDLDKYYVDLYNELMFSEDMRDVIKLDSEYLIKYKEDINSKFNACSDIFKLLDSNRDNYSLEDGEIKFKDNDLVNQYNSYIDMIKA
ncbi:MAG: hypothetical protein Q4E69_01820 [Bacilli bacterium]|nr:hypothetical protein [Bacilli bacterium]